MPEDIAHINDFERDSLRSPARQQSSPDPDWERTARHLMSLAKEANKSFEYDRAIKYLSDLEEICDSQSIRGASAEIRFELYREKGKAFASQGKHEHAIGEYQKILKYCTDSGHLTVKSETFTQIGQLLAKKGDHDRALGYLQRAIGAYRRLRDDVGACRALRNLGVVYVELGEFEEAEIVYKEAIGIAENTGDRMLYADLVNNLGAIMNMKGNWELALEFYRESLHIYKAEKEIRKYGYTQNNIAITLTEQGYGGEAFEYLKSALETASSIKDASLSLIVRINLADLNLKKGALAQARIHNDWAQSYLAENNICNGHLVESQKIAGMIAMGDGRHDDALRCFNDALRISKEIGAQFLEADVLMERGRLYHAMNRHFEALSDLETSFHVYSTVKAHVRQEETEKVIGSVETLYLEIFDSMAQHVDRKDTYTKGHSDRVAAFSLLLGKELGLPIGTLKTIVASALIHDIGKLKIEDDILKKPGSLSSDEYRLVQKHPEVGVELLRGKEFPWDITPAILHHHEKFNGTGYPHGLKGEDIPFTARLLCIADVFDALTSDRVYRPAYSSEKALEIMLNDSGVAFDPSLLDQFVALIRSGGADFIINSRTSEDEMYSIWSQIMKGGHVAPKPERMAETNK